MRSRFTYTLKSSAEGKLMSWYYCLEHQHVEPEDGCANAERMGPYPSKEAAEHALQLAAERNAEFDDEDE